MAQTLTPELHRPHASASDAWCAGDGDMFEGGGLLEGMEIIRTPLLATPQEMPERPSACDAGTWHGAVQTQAVGAIFSRGPCLACVFSCSCLPLR